MLYERGLKCWIEFRVVFLRMRWVLARLYRQSAPYGHFLIRVRHLSCGNADNTDTMLSGPTGSRVIQRACIVCPSSLVKNWAEEFNKWTGVKIKTLVASGASGVDKVFIISLTILILKIPPDKRILCSANISCANHELRARSESQQLFDCKNFTAVIVCIWKLAESENRTSCPWWRPSHQGYRWKQDYKSLRGICTSKAHNPLGYTCSGKHRLASGWTDAHEYVEWPRWILCDDQLS